MKLDYKKNDFSSNLLEVLEQIAKIRADGHLTILKFTTNWRIGFTIPNSREDIDNLWDGESFEEAATQAIAFEIGMMSAEINSLKEKDIK